MPDRSDHAMFELVEDGGKKRAKVTTPHDVVRVRDKAELQAQLDHYSKANGATFLRHVLPDSAHARFNYVRYIRPALRYYCKTLGVEAPEWLKADTAYSTLSDQTLISLFGKRVKFPVAEFKPVKFGNEPAEEASGAAK